MAGIQILGGIGLTLFGVRFLRKGLDRLFGGKLIVWLSKMTANPFKAFGAGFAAGTIAPSSAGLSLAAAQMMVTGHLDARRMLAVLLGANVGLTITVQLLAFHVESYAGLLIILGVIGFQFLSRELFRGLGQCVLSLGFVFLSIQLIGEGAREMTQSPDAAELFRLLQGHPWFIFGAVALLTVILQSSTASIGLGLGLASSGLLTSTIMVPWVIGTNLGLGLTSVVAGWSELESRRMGIGNLLVKLIVSLPLLLLPASALSLFELYPGSLLRQTAMFHTGFNLVVGALALPFLGIIIKAARFLVPSPENQSLSASASFLDANALDTPSFALVRATREILRMADQVRLMMEGFWKAFQSGNIELARRVQKEDDLVDQMNLDLQSYLSRIGDDKSPDDHDWQFTLLAYTNELESVGDFIDKHLCDLLIKTRVEGIFLTSEDQQILEVAYRKILQRFELATRLLTTRNRDDARDFLAGKEAFNDWFRQLRREHYEKQRNRSREDVNASAFFLDFLNALRSINSHLSTLGYAFYRPLTDSEKSKV